MHQPAILCLNIEFLGFILIFYVAIKTKRFGITEMRRVTDKRLYDIVVKCIHENAKDKSLPDELKQAL